MTAVCRLASRATFSSTPRMALYDSSSDGAQTSKDLSLVEKHLYIRAFVVDRWHSLHCHQAQGLLYKFSKLKVTGTTRKHYQICKVSITLLDVCLIVVFDK